MCANSRELCSNGVLYFMQKFNIRYITIQQQTMQQTFANESYKVEESNVSEKKDVSVNA